jgi:hypothetical protein
VRIWRGCLDKLVVLNQQGKDNQATIRDLCVAEKALLERGDSKGLLKTTIAVALELGGDRPLALGVLPSHDCCCSQGAHFLTNDVAVPV